MLLLSNFINIFAPLISLTIKQILITKLRVLFLEIRDTSPFSFPEREENSAVFIAVSGLLSVFETCVLNVHKHEVQKTETELN
jgi:hypothetical protein